VWATNHCNSATRAHDSVAACSCQLHLLDRYSSVRPLFAMKSAIVKTSSGPRVAFSDCVKSYDRPRF